MLYVAAQLESTNNRVLNISLDILEDFVRNENTHATLLNTFGVLEALELVNIR